MFEAGKHISLYLLVLSSGIFLSCKAPKAGAASKEISQPSKAGNADRETNFAFYYHNGCNERMKGNLQQALKIFEECETLMPGRAATAYEMAAIYKLLGNNQKAMNYAMFCAAADKKNEWYQLLLVDCYTSAGMHKQAIKIREDLVKNFPARLDFKEELAAGYAFLGQADRALKIYEQIEIDYGVSEQITMNKVKLLKSQGKPAAVEQELIRLTASDSKETRYLFYLADYYTESNQRDKAKSVYDKILIAEPSNPQVYLALYDYYSRNGMETEAYSYLKKSVESTVLDITTKANIISGYYAEAEKGSESAFKKGKELATVMIMAHPGSTEANGIYGDFLRLGRNSKEAALYYYKAAVNEKRNYRIWKNLLYVENEVGLYDSLERHSAQCTELFPSLPDGYLFNGLANSKLGNYKKASVSLKDGLEFVNDNKSYRLDFLKALADAYNYLRDFSSSDKAFDDALKIDPDNTYVLNNYAYYLSLRNENLEKAERYAKRANEVKPGNGSYMDTYGWVLFMLKKYPEAETWLSRAAKSAPGDAIVLEHHGDALYKLGKTEEALQAWKASGSAGNKKPELLKKILEKKLND